MNILNDEQAIQAKTIWFDHEYHVMTVVLEDGNQIPVPIRAFPRLRNASPEQLNGWRFVGRGRGISWPDLDEDLSVEGLYRSSLTSTGTKR